MKKLNLTRFLMLIAVVAFMAAGCTKEGDTGPAGADGTNGTNGTNGADGTTTCVECHSNDQVLFAVENQWAHSTHALGGNYERNGGDCAICHTSQGFLGYLDGSYDPEAEGAMIANPNPPNCYTCHQIHSTYTPADLAFTVSGPPVLNNTTETFDFGSANLCANCHQGRTVDPFPAEGGAEITVTSTRYGVHHGPQANTIAGLGLFEPGTGYSNHPHSAITNACVTCHMADAYGTQAGGHTMSIEFEYHGAAAIYLEGCVACHPDEDALHEDTEAFQVEIAGLLAELKLLLDAAGITVEGSDSSVPGTYAANVAGACLNYKALTEDRSLGIHNPTYIEKVLVNSIDAMP